MGYFQKKIYNCYLSCIFLIWLNITILTMSYSSIEKVILKPSLYLITYY